MKVSDFMSAPVATVPASSLYLCSNELCGDLDRADAPSRDFCEAYFD
jgi:hypothetical protein